MDTGRNAGELVIFTYVVKEVEEHIEGRAQNTSQVTGAEEGPGSIGFMAVGASLELFLTLHSFVNSSAMC